MPTHGLTDIPSDLAYTRLLIIRAQDRNGRLASRLLLDFLDARTEHQAGRLTDGALRDALQQIRTEASDEPVRAD